MGYPIYKLLRAVNRQYPNNGFINYVDVREDTYDNTEDQMIDEDLRDLINETIQEVYKDVAIDEVYSFPTVPGQNQYVLPEDCDLRDIQEVTRTYQGFRGPLPRPFGPDPDPGDGNIVMFTISEVFGTLVATQGTMIGDNTVTYSVISGDTVPEVPVANINPLYDFLGWSIDGTTVIPIDEILSMPITEPITFTALVDTHYTFDHTVTFTVNPLNGSINGASVERYQVADGQTVPNLPTVTPNTGKEFLGWTLDGTTIIDNSVILSTPVTEDIEYTGKFKNNVDPEPVWDYTIAFQIEANEGELTTEAGTLIGTTTVFYSLTPNDYLTETPAVYPNEGYTFSGWSLDGETIVSVEDILATPATQSLTYTGVFESQNDVDPEPVWDDPSEPTTPVVEPDPETPIGGDDNGSNDNPLG